MCLRANEHRIDGENDESVRIGAQQQQKTPFEKWTSLVSFLLYYFLTLTAVGIVCSLLYIMYKFRGTSRPYIEAVAFTVTFIIWHPVALYFPFKTCVKKSTALGAPFVDSVV